MLVVITAVRQLENLETISRVRILVKPATDQLAGHLSPELITMKSGAVVQTVIVNRAIISRVVISVSSVIVLASGVGQNLVMMVLPADVRVVTESPVITQERVINVSSAIALVVVGMTLMINVLNQIDVDTY